MKRYLEQTIMIIDDYEAGFTIDCECINECKCKKQLQKLLKKRKKENEFVKNIIKQLNDEIEHLNDRLNQKQEEINKLNIVPMMMAPINKNKPSKSIDTFRYLRVHFDKISNDDATFETILQTIEKAFKFNSQKNPKIFIAKMKEFLKTIS